MRTIDLDIDVTDVAQLGEDAHLAATVVVPEPAELTDPPIVCFAKPGALASRAYYTLALPGPARGAQAAWHVQRGWIFVALDHLGTGDSTIPDMSRTDFVTVTRAADAAERTVLARLASGTLAEGFPPVEDAVVLGIGQSMGACLTVVQQAHRRTYDGIAVLGYAVTRLVTPTAPDAPVLVRPWVVRGAPEIVLNAERVTGDHSAEARRAQLELVAWGMFFDDVDREQVRYGDPAAPWTSSTFPGALESVTTPGAVASEAAAVVSPVLIAMGERDVVADPAGEVRAYQSSPAIDLFVCPRMGHMHNFASTRELMWRRLDTWATWVAAQRDDRAEVGRVG